MNHSNIHRRRFSTDLASASSFFILLSIVSFLTAGLALTIQATRSWKGLATLSLIMFLAFAPYSASGQTSNDASTQIADAFVAVRNAEGFGDVGKLVDSLNEAVALVAQAESLEQLNPQGAEQLYLQAEDIASQSVLQASSIREAGLLIQRNMIVYSAVELVVLAALCLAVYRYTPRIFWRLWLNAHREWRVRKV